MLGFTQQRPKGPGAGAERGLDSRFPGVDWEGAHIFQEVNPPATSYMT